MLALVTRLPIWFRKAIVDFVTAFLAGVAAATWVFPSSGTDLRVWAASFGLGILNIALNALRRAAADHLPDFLAWLAAIMQTAPAK